MSKSLGNVVNPDDIIAAHGADCFRMYEMFLGPLEQHKPWDVQGITGVEGFLKKLWRLFHENNKLNVSDQEPTKEELKAIHKAIKKTQEDLERYSFNTPVSIFMICVNELTSLDCHAREVLEPLTVLLAPFAPHIAEELWATLGNSKMICDQAWPEIDHLYLKKNNIQIPVQINGKVRAVIDVPFDTNKQDLEKIAMKEKNVLKFSCMPRLDQSVFCNSKTLTTYNANFLFLLLPFSLLLLLDEFLKV